MILQENKLGKNCIYAMGHEITLGKTYFQSITVPHLARHESSQILKRNKRGYPEYRKVVVGANKMQIRVQWGGGHECVKH